MFKQFLMLLVAMGLVSCSASKSAMRSQVGSYRLAFYNLENLFDATDDPANPGDDEYLPTSKKNWTPARYQTKLDHLAKVVEGMAYPALIGVAEVENEAVLKDFCTKTSLQAHGYGVVHFESPDFRGIDVGLLYQKAVFEVTDAKPVQIKFPVGMIPDKPDYTTRDLLVVEGKLFGKEPVHLVVAHLPSRSDGQKETEPRRQFVASKIDEIVDEIFREAPSANVVVMGDMNDEPTDPSMVQSLGAQAIGSGFLPQSLYNCFAKLQADGQGSYRYRGDWNMLDQIILSASFFQKEGMPTYAESKIFQAEWMMYKDEKYGLSPSRTYGGDRYFGGYSDHLPIYVELR